LLSKYANKASHLRVTPTAYPASDATHRFVGILDDAGGAKTAHERRSESQAIAREAPSILRADSPPRPIIAPYHGELRFPC